MHWDAKKQFVSHWAVIWLEKVWGFGATRTQDNALRHKESSSIAIRGNLVKVRVFAATWSIHERWQHHEEGTGKETIVHKLLFHSNESTSAPHAEW